jgi:hypothetical protein
MNQPTQQSLANQSGLQSLQNNIGQKIIGAEKKETSAKQFQNSDSSKRGAPPANHNCIFNICYNGEARQFALGGQLLAAGEEFENLPPLE